MECKHFSHNHGLAFHQMPQGSEIHCSGCKSPGSENNIYACWQCNHFLHEQCFCATRSLKHPSHTLHPLTLVPYPTYPSASFFCNICNLVGNGLSYTCSECQFDMHVHCALMPNSNLQLPPFPITNDAHNYNLQHHNQIHLPIQTIHFPNCPPHNNAPNFSPQSQNTTHPPLQNNPFTPNFPQPNAPQSNYSPPISTPYTNPLTVVGTSDLTNHINQLPLSAQPNAPPWLNFSHQGSAPQYLNQQTQPITTIPTYSTVLNSTTITPSSPPTCYPTPVQNPQSENSQPKPSIIKHFSHPHILKSMEIDQKLGKICFACECKLTGSSYLCTEPHCTFGLHKTCFDSPLEVHHKSHLTHPLKLLTTPPYKDGFTCNACLKEGNAFVYNCAACSYDLHIDCITWPEIVKRSDHEHGLTLYYSSPDSQTSQEETFICNACKNPVHEMAWIYNCRECDFRTHLECVATALKQESVGTSEKTEAELIREMELKFAMLQILAEGRKAALDLK